MLLYSVPLGLGILGFLGIVVLLSHLSTSRPGHHAKHERRLYLKARRG